MELKLTGVIDKIKADIDEVTAFLNTPRITDKSFIIGLNGIFISPEDKRLFTNPLHADRFTKGDATKLASGIADQHGNQFEVYSIYQASKDYLARCKSIIAQINRENFIH